MRPITPPVRSRAVCTRPERRTTYYNGEADPKDRSLQSRPRENAA